MTLPAVRLLLAAGLAQAWVRLGGAFLLAWLTLLIG
jgi:hypothetical protein